MFTNYTSPFMDFTSGVVIDITLLGGRPIHYFIIVNKHKHVIHILNDPPFT